MHDVSRLLVPAIDDDPWPTLGPDVCDYIEDLLCHGPGDLLGQPVRLSDEYRLFLYRAYEVYPHDHELAGRRRFKRAVLSRRKGLAKTELAALIAIAELDPDAPVRCDGFHLVDGEWQPVGRGVTDPYIPMVAYTEEQTEELAYRAAYEILANCEHGSGFDLTLERISPKDAPGKIEALSSSPSARDGARTTFQHFDETHLFVGPRLKKVHATMQRNVPKRRIADAWALETTTMFGPGEDSVAEDAYDYALAVSAGRAKDARLLYDHRQASERHDITTKRGLRAAIHEASGDAFAWTDVPAIEDLFRDPKTDENANRRYWLNQPRRSAAKLPYLGVWASLARPRRRVEQGARVVLAFDGSYSRDSTVLIGATCEEAPHVFVVKAWERPPKAPASWRISRLEAESEIERAMEFYDVAELAPDPPGWHHEVETWEQTYGETVVRFETNQPRRMGPACDDFAQTVADSAMTHDGAEILSRHLHNCVPFKRGQYEVVAKEHPDSPNKIDAAVGAIVATHRAKWHAANPPKVSRGFALIEITEGAS